jgi:hypothetical protein
MKMILRKAARAQARQEQEEQDFFHGVMMNLV